MVVSRGHKFIFLKTKKTAGTQHRARVQRARRHHHAAHRDRRGAAHKWTRRAELAAAWLVGDFSAAAQAPPNYGFYNHMPAAEVRACLDDRVWRSYFKFAFDRYPWDRKSPSILTGK
jgi:hypothetical protein